MNRLECVANDVTNAHKHRSAIVIEEATQNMGTFEMR